MCMVNPLSLLLGCPPRIAQLFTVHLTILLVAFFFPRSTLATGQRDRLGVATGWLLSTDSTVVQADFDSVRKAVGWARLDVAWDHVQQQGINHYHWDEVDAWVQAALDRDLQVVLTLDFAPAWAYPPNACAQVRARFPETQIHPAPDYDHLSHWIAFCDTVARRYPDVRHFEIGNEPNSQIFYCTMYDDTTHESQNAIAYSDLLVAAALAIRAARPDAIVLLGGAMGTFGGFYNAFAPSPWSWLRSLYIADPNLGSHFDILAYHPYGPRGGPLSSPSSGANSFAYTDTLHSILVAHGDGDKPIWLTEAGYSTNNNAGPDDCYVTEAEQAEFLRDYIDRFFQWPWAGNFFWDKTRDRQPPMSDPADCDSKDDYYGLLRYNYTRKPAFNRLLEYGTGEFHIGEGPDFQYHDLGVEIASRVVLAAMASDTVRIFFHAKGELYYGSLSLLDLETLPSSAALERLEIIGVGADRSSTEPATPGAVVIDALGDRSHLRLNGQVGLTLQDITIQHVTNSDTPREGDPNPMVSSFLHSEGGSVHLEDCAFIDISVGGCCDVDPGGVLTYSAPEGISGFVTAKNCLFVDCAGPEAGVANVTRGSVAVESCTFHKSSGSSSGNCSIHSTSGPVELLGCLFTGSTDGSAASVQLVGGGSLEANYCLFDTQASGYNLTGVGNQFMAPGEAMEQVRYVDTDQGDFRLRWDSACLDRGDPNPAKVDFDQTRSDIGWRPHYPVIEISGNTEITEPGHYLVMGGSATLSGPNTVIPEGTTVKLEGSSVLHIQDTNPSGGHMITVGDPNGARTAIVGPTTTGYILFGEYGIGIPASTCQFHGVLFNRMRPGSFVQFMNCNVDLNGANGNVAFNDYANAQIIFHEVCRGTLRNFNFSAPQIWGGTVGLGSLSLIASDVDLLNVAFNPVPGGQNYGYWKVWVSGMAPGNANQVIAGCTIPCNDNTYGVYPLFAQDAGLTLHHNQFTNIQQGAIYMYSSTLNMANGAMNTFDKPTTSPVFDGNPIIIGWGGNVDLHCGYNSFTNDLITSPYKYFEAPCFSGDWRSNFWGRDCTTPLDPGPFLPTCVTNYLPTLSLCPNLFMPCENQTGEDSPLYTLGADADADANYEAACAYWTALMVEFPTSKFCTKVTGAMKAIGLVTEYGVESYGLIRSNLEAAAAQSEPVDFLLSVSQRCAAWCVEARHGDRPAALGLLNALLAEVNGNKDAKVLINVAIAEIGTYPLPGAMSAMQPGMEIARLEQQTQQLRAFQLALLPEETRAHLAQEDLVEAQAVQPIDLTISRVYPNPFNPVATIELVSRGDLPLSLEVYNLAGQRVATLQNGMVSAGNHRYQWDASDLASGLYFLRAEQGTKQEISKLMLIR